jgi:hypothetical protein
MYMNKFTGGLEPLQLLTRSHDLASQQQAAASLRDLASNINYKAIMAEEGCLLRAIELSKNNDEVLRVLGLGTIRHLCINTRVKRPFYEQGISRFLYPFSHGFFKISLCVLRTHIESRFCNPYVVILLN